MQWTAIDVVGSAPACRLDFATCTLRLRLPPRPISHESTCTSHSEETRNTSSSSHVQASQHSGATRTVHGFLLLLSGLL